MASSRMQARLVFTAACAMMLAMAPLAVRAQHVANYQVPGVQVELNSVTRTPTGSILVKWAYHNTTAQPQTITAAVCVLELNGAKYPASVTGGGSGSGAQAATSGKNIVVNAHDTYAAWAVVKDPNPNAGKVTVHITGADPFTDVPVSGS